MLRIFYDTSLQAVSLIAVSKKIQAVPFVGRILTVLIDNVIHHFYGCEVTSRSIEVDHLILGHTVGIVLGGNGIKCDGKLHLSSGVVFARKYGDEASRRPLFIFEGDVTIGANSVLVGPLKIKGPTTIGALTLVNKDIVEPGVYVGSPAKKI